MFERALELGDEEGELAGWARELGVRLGEEVVPDERLAVEDRRAVLALRRTLHAGGVPEGAGARRVVREGVAPLAPAMARELDELCRAAASLSEARERFERDIAAERERVGTLLVTLFRSDPVLRDFVARASPRVVADLARRAAAGEPWGGKRQRKGTGYLWRALGRAAAKTTPRDWIGQLAVVPVRSESGPGPGPGLEFGPGPGGPGPEPGPGIEGSGGPRESAVLLRGGPVLGEVAGRLTENVHLLWAELRNVDLRAAGTGTLVAPAPLHHLLGEPGTGHVHCWVVDPAVKGARLRRLALRRTPPLEAVLTLLRSGPCSLGGLEESLAASAERTVLRAFLAHLHRMGALQICAGPEARQLDWTVAGGSSGSASFRQLSSHPLSVPHPQPDSQPRPAPRSRSRSLLSVPPSPSPSPLPPSSPLVTGGRREPRGWFLDSYRRLEPGAVLDGGAVARVAEGVGLARRVAGLRTRDRPASARWREWEEAASIGPEPRSVVQIMAEHLPGDGAPAPGPRGRARYSGWEPARTSDSGYARLLAHIGARLDEEQVDLDATLLDALGAPEVPGVREAWPTDCLLRPLPQAGPHAGAGAGAGLNGGAEPHASGGPYAGTGLYAGTGPYADAGLLAVLETVSPAGTVDARFADALAALHGTAPNTARPTGPEPPAMSGVPMYANAAVHRDFLAAFERAAGVRFVEVLLPPLAESAANAVRRPALTSWCTGDPNTALYYGDTAPCSGAPAPAPAGASTVGPGPGISPRPGPRSGLPAAGRYLPLDRLTLRSEGDALIAEADGVRVLPVHHATRTPAPPYDGLLRLLTAAGHPATSYAVQLDGLAAAFPEAPRVPRLTVGGVLVVSPAQWRVPRAALWRPGEPEAAKVAALARLRRSARLPRFGYVRPEPAAKPFPADLAALPVLQALERLCRATPGEDLIFEEALSGPGATTLRDRRRGPGTGAGPGTRHAEFDGVAGELLLRLPHDRTASELAALAHAAWRGVPELPGPRPPDGGAPGRTPQPH
ncbi:lantibiotic dehydratase family protein [Streptomyces sp. NBC_01775]|uniref:lantibiotic dehydratase n=1 Tax=Streptomyces sp. NBC_01775 TaxID=2975939 RepID=UPI002DD8C77D|nr:lantibiotic dehydratase [Streptomyces sp. NBC_01775]WSB79845.1 lantibiotic dehydratase family protein [Streptomyces sp. NBC_01775]